MNRVLHKPTNQMVMLLNFKPGKIQVMFQEGDNDGEVMTLPEEEFDLTSWKKKPLEKNKKVDSVPALKKKKAPEKPDDDDVLSFMEK